MEAPYRAMVQRPTVTLPQARRVRQSTVRHPVLSGALLGLVGLFFLPVTLCALLVWLWLRDGALVETGALTERGR